MINNPMYVPILKWKKGEAEALNKLSDDFRNKILPLIEITDYKLPDELFSDLENYFPHPVYIDTLIAAEDDRDFLVSITSKFNENSKNIYPVIYYDDLDDITQELIKFTDRIAIRILVPEDIDSPSYQEIFKQLEAFKDSNNIILDIILDLGLVDKRPQANLKYNELKSVLNMLKEATFANRIIIALTSFPEDISIVPAGGMASFERYDFRIFNKIIDEFNILDDKLVYSDFGVTKFTETDLDYSLIGSRILPKVRYTTADMYWVLKGKKDRIVKSNSITYKNLAEKIIKENFYYGENFSFGDLDIYERANCLNRKGPGNHQNWVTISANHHITAVVEQLSKIL